MDTRLRALLRKELRLGAVVTFAGTLAGLLVHLALYYTTIREHTAEETMWTHVGGLALAITLSAPLLTAVILLLSTLELGRMRGAVSLPRAVVGVFAMRFAFTAFVAVAMTVLCWGLYKNGPGILGILATLGVGLVLQAPTIATGRGNKLGALLWEELRTGGFIAAVAFVSAPLFIGAILGGAMA